jgi:hypothetical protein
MSNDPQQWLFDSIEDCCDKYYFWDMRSCLGSDPSYVDPTTVLYYPDWESGVCIRDGNAPDYIRNQHTFWMFESLSDCCKQYHSYNYNACITSEGDVVDPTATMYYPDWDGSNNGCIADGNAPDYMVANPSHWMFESLSECCERFYSWDLSRCDPSGSSTSNLWCMSWDSNSCVQGCNSWDYTYETQVECCDQSMWWDKTGCLA